MRGLRVMENLIKIRLAAERAEVTQRTIYTWIRNGVLHSPRQGYVDLADLDCAIETVRLRKIEQARLRSERFERDERGKFRLLSGELNYKNERGLL